jgi:uncharacterized membrane protein (UPF0127 family)
VIPHPSGADEESHAGAGDLAVGLTRAFWPWAVFVALVLAFFGFLLWGANRPDDPAVEGGARTVATPDDGLAFTEERRSVGEDCLELLVADDATERASGLRHRESELQRVDGMLFVSGEPTDTPFTMSGVVEPLQIGFYDAAGQPIGGHAMDPCPDEVGCPSYPPEDPWSFALETAPGGLPDGPLGGSCPA